MALNGEIERPSPDGVDRILEFLCRTSNIWLELPIQEGDDERVMSHDG